MGLIEIYKNATGKNAALKGGVSPGRFGRERVEDVVAQVTGYTGAQKLASGMTVDHYGGITKDDEVSIEGARVREEDLKDVLDGRLPAENLGWDDEGFQGLKPCDLLRRKGR